jgi:hypothetical protein
MPGASVDPAGVEAGRLLRKASRSQAQTRTLVRKAGARIVRCRGENPRPLFGSRSSPDFCETPNPAFSSHAFLRFQASSADPSVQGRLSQRGIEMKNLRLTAALIALGSIAGLTTSASAGDDVFRFNRASFAHEQGVARTLQVIDFAAANRCTRTGRTATWQKRFEQDCIAGFKEEVIEQIADTRLTAAAEGSLFLARK